MQNQTGQQQQQGDGHFFWIKKHLIKIVGALFLAICITALVFGIWAVEDANNIGVKNLSAVLGGIILPIFGQIFTFLQVYFLLHPPGGPSVPSIAVLQQASFSSATAAAYSKVNINRIPPSTTSRVILQLKKSTKDIYKNLQRLDITTMVLTGIAGAGKSTVAALIYRSYCASGFLRGLFCCKPLWLEIKPQHTFNDIIEEIFNYLNTPFPSNFSNLDISGKAVAIANAMARVRKARLVVLDQLDNWLDCKTGYSLPQYSDMDALLYVLNNQVSKCQIILTSRIWPRIRTRVASADPKICMTEYIVKDLKFRDGAELLRKRGVNATPAVLFRVVKYCHGHAGALARLATVLQDEPTLQLNVDDSRYIQRWRAAIIDMILKNIYLQLELSQLDILTDFCIYRAPTPLEVVLGTSETSLSEETWEDLNVLLRQHLLQKVDSNCYCLHPMVVHCSRDYLFESNKLALQTGHYNAAKYYQKLGWPTKSERRSVQDMQNVIEVIWHLCHAKCWSEAYNLMKQEGISTNLKDWKEHDLLLELYELFLPLGNWKVTREQALDIYTALSETCNMLRNKNEAKRWQKEASLISEKSS
jgi:NB-ARC domain